MIPIEIQSILKKQTFVTIATCNLKHRPNVAPKFLLDIRGRDIYIVDYVMNRTLKNIKVNPKVAISVMDLTTLYGYQLRGLARILKEKNEKAEMTELLNEKLTSLSIDRVISAVRTGRKTEQYEISFPGNIAIFKIKVNEIVWISPRGTLKREKIREPKPLLKTTIKTQTIPFLIPIDIVKKD